MVANNFGYRFRYRNQFGLFTLNYAKALKRLLGSLRHYTQFRLFIIDLRYFGKFQNPPGFGPWGFGPLPAPGLSLCFCELSGRSEHRAIAQDKIRDSHFAVLIYVAGDRSQRAIWHANSLS